MCEAKITGAHKLWATINCNLEKSNLTHCATDFAGMPALRRELLLTCKANYFSLAKRVTFHLRRVLVPGTSRKTHRSNYLWDFTDLLRMMPCIINR